VIHHLGWPHASIAAFLIPSAAGHDRADICVQSEVKAIARLQAGETQADIARSYATDATTIGRCEAPDLRAGGRAHLRLECAGLEDLLVLAASLRLLGLPRRITLSLRKSAM
jgi:hypothetical protein